VISRIKSAAAISRHAFCCFLVRYCSGFLLPKGASLRHLWFHFCASHERTSANPDVSHISGAWESVPQWATSNKRAHSTRRHASMPRLFAPLGWISFWSSRRTRGWEPLVLDRVAHGAARGSLANGYSPDPAGLAPNYSKSCPLTVSFRSQVNRFVRLLNAWIQHLGARNNHCRAANHRRGSRLVGCVSLRSEAEAPGDDAAIIDCDDWHWPRVLRRIVEGLAPASHLKVSFHSKW